MMKTLAMGTKKEKNAISDATDCGQFVIGIP